MSVFSPCCLISVACRMEALRAWRTFTCEKSKGRLTPYNLMNTNLVQAVSLIRFNSDVPANSWNRCCGGRGLLQSHASAINLYFRAPPDVVMIVFLNAEAWNSKPLGRQSLMFEVEDTRRMCTRPVQMRTGKTVVPTINLSLIIYEEWRGLLNYHCVCRSSNVIQRQLKNWTACMDCQRLSSRNTDKY